MKHRKLCWVGDRRGWLTSATRGGTTGWTWLTALERGGSALICAFNFLAKGTFLLITFSNTHIQTREVFVGSCCCLVARSLTLCDPMNCSTPGFPVLHYLPEFAETLIHWLSEAIHPSHPLFPLLLLPSVFPSIRVFSNESALHISWPKYWSINISPSNKY